MNKPVAQVYKIAFFAKQERHSGDFDLGRPRHTDKKYLATKCHIYCSMRLARRYKHS